MKKVQLGSVPNCTFFLKGGVSEREIHLPDVIVTLL